MRNKKGKIVLVSNCGFWEKDNFDVLIAHMKAMCKNMNHEFAGALIRPHGEAFAEMLKIGVPVKDVLESAREAGRQLVKDGKISEKTLSTVSRELLPLDMFLEKSNQYFKQTLETLKKVE
jgi:hypothetical protein